MMMKNGQSKQLYHLKSSYVQIGDQDNPITFLGFCAEEIQDDFFGTIPPMGSLSPNEYCGAKIRDILITIDLNRGVGYFGTAHFYGKLPENAVGEYMSIVFTIPQLDNLQWTTIVGYNESTNITQCASDETIFAFDNLGSLENLYITIAPDVPGDNK